MIVAKPRLKCGPSPYHAAWRSIVFTLHVQAPLATFCVIRETASLDYSMYTASQWKGLGQDNQMFIVAQDSSLNVGGISAACLEGTLNYTRILVRPERTSTRASTISAFM